ncbi:hypothetical protein ACTS91_07830 [Empedobacter falsenii]|uniref:Uncharacterized protein n=1 Tax=Empedobacter falsenii TaxID=343874 RepID=A0A7H9DWD0_9FLAO|nr:hypothetical protein [Empedobacter falsenii]QLL59494.1 hypothetical protein FH779_15985 [Empedobacter falsenii]
MKNVIKTHHKTLLTMKKECIKLISVILLIICFYSCSNVKAYNSIYSYNEGYKNTDSTFIKFSDYLEEKNRTVNFKDSMFLVMGETMLKGDKLNINNDTVLDYTNFKEDTNIKILKVKRHRYTDLTFLNANKRIKIKNKKYYNYYKINFDDSINKWSIYPCKQFCW